MYQAKFKKYRLEFIRPSGTSKGVLSHKDSWFIKLWRKGNPEIAGHGECGPLHWLSKEPLAEMDAVLQRVCANPEPYLHDLEGKLGEIPSVRFGLEMALKDLQNDGKLNPYPSAFTEENSAQHINGLIWMGDADFMLKQIQDKLDLGFSCLKLKIGAIDFEKEIAVLKNIRAHYSAQQIEIRVDANGAFPTTEAAHKLERLAAFDLHSIEQPIATGQWQEMQALCQEKIIDIALDEELIGIYGDKKRRLLENIKPQYLILKPSMLGGFEASEEWINLAKEQGCKYWTTSALESNIGLNAIAQWTAMQDNSLPQGLGTGQLYSNNFDSPLYLKGDQLYFSKSKEWNLKALDL